MNANDVLERIRDLEAALVETREAVTQAVNTEFPTGSQLANLLYQVEMLKMWRMLHVHLLDNIPLGSARDRTLKWASRQQLQESPDNGMGNFGVAIALVKSEARSAFRKMVPLP